MSGRLYGVVGPSGVGKDSVMQAVAEAEGNVALVRRVITRPAEAGGEDFDGVSETQFDARIAAGDFALHWDAHGLRYGVPTAVDDLLAQGRPVLVNLSRAVLLQAQARFPGFTVLSLHAPVDVLAHRLAHRGRETAEEITKRLARANYALPQGLERVVQIDNGGALQITVAKVLDVLAVEKTKEKT